MYELTKEGKRYLKEGLPEKKLIELLKKKSPLSIKEVNKSIENAAVAINWAKKNGWIEIKNNEIYPLVSDIGNEIEEALRKVDKNLELDSKILKILLSRKLIKEKKKSILERAEEILHIGAEEKAVEITQLTPEIIKSGIWKKKKIRKYDIKTLGAKINPGKYQPYMRIIDDVKEKLISLGFVEMAGPLVELSFWNYDALFQPQDHPARDLQDVFYLKNPQNGIFKDSELIKKVKKTHENGWITGSKGWGEKWLLKNALKLVARSHTTAVSARTLYKEGDKEGKYFVINRNYRHDVTDATHLTEFYQCEGIVIGEKLNFKHLLGYMKEIGKALGIKKMKFRPAYFPYTEPSVEDLAKHPKAGWIELGGAGIFRPEMCKPLGIDVPVLAWGLGMERLAMIKLGLNDIRDLFSKDLKFLREKALV